MESPATTPLYLDCDTGIDDALALALLLANPAVDLVGIGTVSGNIDAARAGRNTLDLLSLAGRTDIPVAVGAQDPLAGLFDGGAPHVHGANGIGGVELTPADVPVADATAAELLIELARAHPGRLEVVAVGPLTNLALALEIEPALPSLVAGVTVMGGAVWVPGNVSPVAEANICNDPEAAAIALKAAWPVTLLPLDVTMEHNFDDSHQAAYVALGTEFHTALGTMLGTYIDFYETVFAERRSALHDPLAAAVAVGQIVPDGIREVGIDVVTGDGADRGQTVPVEGGSPVVRVVTSAPRDSAEILHTGILSLVAR